MKYPEIMENYSMKMTEARFINWRETIGTIVNIKNGKPPDEIFEKRNPPYLCKQPDTSNLQITNRPTTMDDQVALAPILRSTSVVDKNKSSGKNLQYLDKFTAQGGRNKNFKKFEPNVLAIANNILYGNSTKIETAKTFYFDRRSKSI